MTNVDESICFQLEMDISDVLERWENDDIATPEEAAVTLMGACASVIASISCKHCRGLAAASVLKNFPDIIGDAMKFAAEQFGDDPPIGRVH
jgi:hypothetical protein